MKNTRVQPVMSRPGENAVFIVLGLGESDAVVETVRNFSANFSALTRSLTNRFPDAQFNATLGFGAKAWDRLFPELSKPKELVEFEEIKGIVLTSKS